MKFENITTTSASPESITKPLTLEDIREAFENLERYKPEFDQVAMNKATLDKLIEHGLKYNIDRDYWQNIIISEFCIDDFMVGYSNGKAVKIMKLEWTDTE